MTTRVLVVNLSPVGAEKPHYLDVSTRSPHSGEVTPVAKVAPGGYADFYVHRSQDLVISEKEI